MTPLEIHNKKHDIFVRAVDQEMDRLGDTLDTYYFFDDDETVKICNFYKVDVKNYYCVVFGKSHVYFTVPSIDICDLTVVKRLSGDLDIFE